MKKRIRLSADEKRALEIIAMMDSDGKTTLVPRFLADSLHTKSLVEIVATNPATFGLERTVRFTEAGRERAMHESLKTKGTK